MTHWQFCSYCPLLNTRCRFARLVKPDVDPTIDILERDSGNFLLGFMVSCRNKVPSHRRYIVAFSVDEKGDFAFQELH